MTREVKVRAWDTQAHDWVEGLTLTIHTSGGLLHIPEHIILTWFTGLKDRLGKDIYEGDIIKHPPYWHDDRKVHAVKDIHMFCGDYGNYGDIETEIEVIGNIYKHSELLQKAGNA